MSNSLTPTESGSGVDYGRYALEESEMGPVRDNSFTSRANVFVSEDVPAATNSIKSSISRVYNNVATHVNRLRNPGYRPVGGGSAVSNSSVSEFEPEVLEFKQTRYESGGFNAQGEFTEGGFIEGSASNGGYSAVATEIDEGVGFTYSSVARDMKEGYQVISQSAESIRNPFNLENGGTAASPRGIISAIMEGGSARSGALKSLGQGLGRGLAYGLFQQAGDIVLNETIQTLGADTYEEYLAATQDNPLYDVVDPVSREQWEANQPTDKILNAAIFEPVNIVWDAAGAVLNAPITALRSIASVAEGAVGLGEGVIDILTGDVAEGVGEIGQGFVTALTPAWEAVQPVFNDISELGHDIHDMITYGAGNTKRKQEAEANGQLLEDKGVKSFQQTQVEKFVSDKIAALKPPKGYEINMDQALKMMKDKKNTVDDLVKWATQDIANYNKKQAESKSKKDAKPAKPAKPTEPAKPAPVPQPVIPTPPAPTTPPKPDRPVQLPRPIKSPVAGNWHRGGQVQDNSNNILAATFTAKKRRKKLNILY